MRLSHPVLRCISALALSASLSLTLAIPSCKAQTKTAPKKSAAATAPSTREDAESGVQFLAMLGKLNEKFQSNMKLPAPRAESRLLPLLPSSTVGFASFANYGDLAHQAEEFLDQQLKEDEELRDWWNRGQMVTMGPKIKDGLQHFYELNQFLGDEIALSASMDTKDPSFLAVAEIRKPGFKKFLSDVIQQYGGEEKAGVHMLEPQEFANRQTVPKKDQLLILVRPDFVLASSDMATLRGFNEALDRKNPGMFSTQFGKRLAQEYAGGLDFLAAADLQTILSKAPPKMKEDDGLKKSGFGDAKYAIWEHKELGSKTISQSELSFTGPRRGSAAWLDKPGPLKSLDFISPDAIVAGALRLTSPARIFEEVQAMLPPGPSNPLASLPQAEKALGLNVNDDLLDLLGGELGFEVDSINPPTPAWRVLLSVKDPAHLQKTFTTLLALGSIKTEQSEEDGVIYHGFRVPSNPKPYEIDYAFLDGFLVAGSSHSAVAEGVRLHRSGESLAKSAKFRAALPPGRSSEASLLFYDDPAAIAKLQMMRMGASFANLFGQPAKDSDGAIFCLYGEDSAIREAHNSSSLGMGGMLVVAAVAIPNLIKSRTAANEASAVGSLRTITTAQIAYATAYPKRGFSPNLARLGPVPTGGNTYASPMHADFLDATLGGPTCTGDAWCTKSGYQFHVSATCGEGNCTHFVAVAKPESPSSGTRSFCVTDDGVIHYQFGGQLPERLTIAECRKWRAIQ